MLPMIRSDEYEYEVPKFDLEKSDIKLDDMLKLYEEGSELIKLCLSKLDDVEKKIRILSADADNTINESPLEED